MNQRPDTATSRFNKRQRLTANLQGQCGGCFDDTHNYNHGDKHRTTDMFIAGGSGSVAHVRQPGDNHSKYINQVTDEAVRDVVVEGEVTEVDWQVIRRQTKRDTTDTDDNDADEHACGDISCEVCIDDGACDFGAATTLNMIKIRNAIDMVDDGVCGHDGGMRVGFVRGSRMSATRSRCSKPGPNFLHNFRAACINAPARRPSGFPDGIPRTNCDVVEAVLVACPSAGADPSAWPGVPSVRLRVDRPTAWAEDRRIYPQFRPRLVVSGNVPKLNGVSYGHATCPAVRDSCWCQAGCTCCRSHSCGEVAQQLLFPAGTLSDPEGWTDRGGGSKAPFHIG